MNSIHFLKLLKQKLTIGNRRSIQLNALPGKRLNRLDVMDLAYLNEHIPEDFLNTLLTKSKFNFLIQSKHTAQSLQKLSEDKQKAFFNTIKRLDAIVYENNDNFLEHGVKPFAFGYPMLIKRDRQHPEKIIKAPILIWNLDIERSYTHSFRWNIKREDDYPIYMNQVLVSHIENDEFITIKNIAEYYLDDALVDATEVLEICNQILTQLGANEEYPASTLVETPRYDSMKHLDVTKACIRWSGVFGLFRTQKQSIIKDIDYLIEHPKEFSINQLTNDELYDGLSDFDLRLETNFYDKDVAPYQKNTFCGVLTDPSQQAIVNRISRHPQQIIQGPPGTGKSQSLTAIITNALANNAKCLVVCEKRTALEVIQENLKELGLDELTILIEDISKDRKKVVGSVRERIDRKEDIADFQEKVYQGLLTITKEIQNSLLEQHQFLAQKKLGNYNWTDIVGLYLKSEEEQSKDILANDLTTAVYDFTLEEYQELTYIIERGKLLFEAIKTLDHPLDIINHRLYKEENAGELLFSIKNKCTNLLAQAKSVHTQLLTTKEKYREILEIHYDNCYHGFYAFKEQIEQAIEENFNKYDHNFNHRTGFRKAWVNTWKWASSSFKDIQQQQETILKKYEELVLFYQQHNYFKHEFSIITKDKPLTFNHLSLNIKDLGDTLARWQISYPIELKRYVDQLHLENIHPNIDFHATLTGTLQRYQQLIAAANEADILNVHVVENRSSVNAQLVSVQLLIENLETILDNIGDFRKFYTWKYFFLQLNAQQSKLLLTLIAKNPKNWLTAFNSWYYYFLLARNESSHTPDNGHLIRELSRHLRQIRQAKIQKIIYHWTGKQQKAVRLFNDKGKEKSLTIKRLYNKRGSKGQKRNSLRKIIQKDLELFTDFFPVLLVNPTVCSSILPLKENIFEVVIFDEASQLRLEDTFCALLRGKYKIISGDIHQMPPSSYFGSSKLLLLEEDNDEEEDDFLEDQSDLAIKESLLSYAEDMNYERSFLDFHYRSRHPALIAFSNAAFYGSRLVPLPTQQAYKPIRFIAVNGEYDKRVNHAEADKVIYLLINEIQPFSNGEYPSIGIATFNMMQRNLILDKLQALQMGNDLVAQKIAILRAKGLFVKNLENIQGDERDVIIISTTFGVRKDGRFLQLFGPINQSKGYKLLNVIITRAKHQLYICTSIPPEFYRRYDMEIKEKGITGRSCLYAYLAYAQAIETENVTLQNVILELLKQHGIEKEISKENKIVHSVFIEEIAKKLKENIAPERVEIYKQVGGFVIDMVVHPSENMENGGSKSIAIECDNSKEHHSSEAHIYDIYRQQQLEQLGYQVHRIYSTNFWLNEEQAFRDLLAAL